MNRKQFLKTSALAGVSALVTPNLIEAFDNSNTISRPLIKKSLKYWMIQEELPLIEKFKLVKSLGFDGIELDSPNELDKEEILAAKAATGLELPGVVNSVHWKKPLSHPDASVRVECAASMEVALNDCKTYGGTTVLLVPAVVNEGTSYQEAYERSQAEIRKLLPLAEELGVKIAIENVWNNFLLSPLEAARYIDEFESDAIGWYMDIGNIIRYGYPEQWIATLGKRILKIDIKDYSREKANEEGVWKGFETLITEGSVNWAKVNRALEKVGYQGWGSAEVGGGNRKRLKQIAELMDKAFRS